MRTTPGGAGPVRVPAGVVVVGDGEPGACGPRDGGRAAVPGERRFVLPAGPVAARRWWPRSATRVGGVAAGRPRGGRLCRGGVVRLGARGRLGVRVTAVESDAVGPRRRPGQPGATSTPGWWPPTSGGGGSGEATRPSTWWSRTRPGRGSGAGGRRRRGGDPGASGGAGELRPGVAGARRRVVAPGRLPPASVALVDAFPHTFHVETVSRFDVGGEPRQSVTSACDVPRANGSSGSAATRQGRTGSARRRWCRPPGRYRLRGRCKPRRRARRRSRCRRAPSRSVPAAAARMTAAGRRLRGARPNRGPQRPSPTTSTSTERRGPRRLIGPPVIRLRFDRVRFGPRTYVPGCRSRPEHRAARFPAIPRGAPARWP